MSLLTQEIPHFLSGVSQRPALFRDATELEEQVNAWSDTGRGLMKRPGSSFIAELDSDTTGWDEAFVHAVNRDANERHRLVVANGVLKVFDGETGSELTVVERDNAFDYLATAPDGFRAVSIGDSTILVNRATVPAKSTATRTDRQIEEAFVIIRQADFSTRYSISVGFLNSDMHTVTYVTDDESTAQARGQLNTDRIAEQLLVKLRTSPIIKVHFKTSRSGSTIRIWPRSSVFLPFRIAVTDGLGGQGMRAVYGKVQQIEDLPLEARQNALLKIERDVDTPEDDIWVTFDREGDQGGTSEGVWKETVGPGLLTELDETTMPHLLERRGSLFGTKLMQPFASKEPVQSEGSDASFTGGWTMKEDRTAITEAEDTIITDHADGVRRPIPIGIADGSEAEVRIEYDIDTSVVRWGENIRVALYREPGGGGAKTLVDFRDHNPGEALVHEVMELETDAYADQDEIVLVLEYGSGTTPNEDRQARLTAQGHDSTNPFDPKIRPSLVAPRPEFPEDADDDDTRQEVLFTPIDFNNPGELTLTFDTSLAYPLGTKITVGLFHRSGDFFSSGSFHTYTTTSGDTGAEVATALQALIDAEANWAATNPSSGVLTIDDLTTGAIATVNTWTRVKEDTFYNADMSLVTNEFAGKTIENLTDGSEGTVQSNDATTILMDATGLTGGNANEWRPGDKARIKESGTYFVFKPIDWAARGAGDDDTNPFPSFVENERPIRDVFHYRGRLGFLAGADIVFSRTNDLFDLWRSTVATLADDDRIDITASTRNVTNFDSAILWNQRLYLIAENVQFLLSAEPVLGPTTVRLDPVASYFIAIEAPPEIAGRRMYFAGAKDNFVQLFELPPPEEDQEDINDAVDLTEPVPTYIPGAVKRMDVEPDLGLLVLTTDDSDSRNHVYVYSWTQAKRREGQPVVQSAISRWEFPASDKIVGLNFIDGKLGIISVRPDGVFLDEIDLGGTTINPTDAADEQSRYMDRRMTESTTGVSVAVAGGDTTITIPFDVNTDQVTDGELIVANRSTGTLYDGADVTRPAANQIVVTGVDLTGKNLYIGIKETMEITLSPIFLRDRDGLPESRGRLQLRNIEIHYHDTTDFDILVTPQGRSQKTIPLAQQDPGDGTLHAAVMTRGDTVEIKLQQATAGGARFNSATWEGLFHKRGRQR